MMVCVIRQPFVAAYYVMQTNGITVHAWLLYQEARRCMSPDAAAIWNKSKSCLRFCHCCIIQSVQPVNNIAGWLL